MLAPGLEAATAIESARTWMRHDARPDSCIAATRCIADAGELLIPAVARHVDRKRSRRVASWVPERRPRRRTRSANDDPADTLDRAGLTLAGANVRPDGIVSARELAGWDWWGT